MTSNFDEEGRYTGDACLSGECALCNCDHPDHKAACAKVDELLGGGGSWHSQNCEKLK